MSRVDEALKAGVEPKELVAWLNSQLRGSLHFSWIKERAKRFASRRSAELAGAPLREFGRSLESAKAQRKNKRALPRYRIEPISRRRPARASLEKRLVPEQRPT